MRNTEKDAKGMAARREEILKQAFKLFAKNTIEPVQLQQIAEESGIGVATLYRYFGNKSELVIAVAANEMNKFEESMAEIYKKKNVEAMTGIEEFSIYLESFIFMFEKKKNILKFLSSFDSYVAHEGLNPEQMRPYYECLDLLRHRFEKMYAKAKADGTFRTEMHEQDLFYSTLYPMFSTAQKYANGILYPSGEATEMDYVASLRMLKDSIISYLKED